MFRSVSFVGISFLVLLAGCSRTYLIDKLSPSEDVSSAREYVELLRQQKFNEIEKDMLPSLVSSDSHDKFVEMAAAFPPEQPKSVKVVSVQTFRGDGFYKSSITLEYEFSSKWLLANISTWETGGTAWITGFTVQPIPDSLEKLNRFSLAGRSVWQYIILLLALLSLLFSLYAFVLCLRTKIEKRKWLWTILTLIGVGRLGVDWTTGQSFYNLFFVYFPTGGAAAPPYGSWAVFATLPLGAIIFMASRQNLIARANPATVAAE